MITTVTWENMVTVPAKIARRFGIVPGYKLDWQPLERKKEIRVRVIPNRATLAKQLFGAGRKFHRNAT